MAKANSGTVTIGVDTMEQTKARMLAAFNGKPQGARISFASVELLWKVLAPKRLEIVQALAGAGPLAIREVARRVGRDVRAVHADITALLDAGVLDRAEDGGVEFPYKAVHVDFTLQPLPLAA